MLSPPRLSRAEARNRLERCRPEFELKHDLEGVESDSTTGQGLSITIFGQVRLTSEVVCSLFDGLAEREIFKSMKRIVVN